MKNADKRTAPGSGIQLGLSPNFGQFTLLVLVNAFVGAMVGLERTILPAGPSPVTPRRRARVAATVAVKKELCHEDPRHPE